MDLVYTDKNRIEQGNLLEYNLDLAYGVDENDFQLVVPLESHCCEDDCFIYIEGTEYGGIVDSIKPNSNNKQVTYFGRTWHGILDNLLIQPDVGQDYVTLDGDANTVLEELIVRLGIQDLFIASRNNSGIEISSYQMPRYAYGYTGIRDMLASVDAKLHLEYTRGLAVLSAVPLIDYSQDEEWDTSQMDFVVQKNYNPVNHVICAGQGELGERYIIHVFTDENGGLQDYATSEIPLQDSEYILDKSKQLLFGHKEVSYYYDFRNATVQENYILQTSQPKDWRENYKNYYSYDPDSDRYSELGDIENGEAYTALTSKPNDWNDDYGKYYKPDGIGGYESVESVEKISYKKLTKKPRYWSKLYHDYYYYYTDGTTSEYRSVDGVTKEYYKIQTRRPTDWKSNYRSYYKRKKKGGYESISAKRAPKWVAKKYYTKKTKTTVPAWKNSFYSKIVTESIPTFSSGKYYSKTTKYKAPAFVKNKYYKKVLDHYADMIEKTKELLGKQAMECDNISIKLPAETEQVYDIGDIVGAAESITGISVWQPITKKIVNISNNTEPTVSYVVG